MRLSMLLAAALATACGPSVSDAPDGGNGGDDGGGGNCTNGVTRCDGQIFQACSDGVFRPVATCPMACHDSLGCVMCIPGTGTCSGEIAHTCRPDGLGYEDFHCDPVQGNSCNFETGICEGACAPQNILDSYIGCEYYPTVTANDVDNNFQFAVAIANTSSEAADITIEDGALASPMYLTVLPGDVAVQYLPWVEPLKACSSYGAFECGSVTTQGVVAQNGAYHLRSTRPVTVYQFSPLDYQLSGGAQFSYTNDASLLLPANALTGNYVVAAWPSWPFYDPSSPGFITISATADGTNVTVNTRTAAVAGTAVPAFTAGVPQTITLNDGDAMQIMAFSGDLTGSVVQADKPVQVISGHYCTNVPADIPYCDHLEESLFPVETLSTRYVVTAPALPSLPNGKEEVIRVVATQQDTTLTYDPPIGAPDTLASTGDFLEIPRHAGDFVVTANHKIIVAQFMEGQEAGGGTGDPAMALAVATDQYRSRYVFHAPLNYETNYVNVTAPTGTVVTLDGTVVTGYTPVGSSGYGVARVQLGPGVNGNHTATGDQPFGISVYGYGQYTSFWYPGGLDLAEIPVE